MTGNQIVAVSDASGEFVGAIVWWRLSGGLDLDKLRACWESNGLPEKMLPEEVSPKVAFSRACTSARAPRRLVRPLEKRNGFAIVDERASQDDLFYSQRVTLQLSIVGRVEAKGSDPSDTDTNALIEAIKQSYLWHQDNLVQQDVSSWLCKLMTKLEAVSLRDTGGVYFVPAHTLALWERMSACVRGASAHAMLGVPAMRTEQAVEAALDAIATESASAIEHLEKALESHEQAESRDEGLLGPRALKSRIRETEGVEAKLSRYEKLLGSKLPDLHERLEALRGNLVIAEMQAEG